MLTKIVRADGVTELTSIKSAVYTETVNAGENLKPGCVASAYIDVEVYGAQSSAPNTGEALTYYQVDENNVQTLIGIFYAEPSVPTKNTYKFLAYDAVSKLDKPYSERLNSIQSSFPMSIYALVSDACTYAGVTLGSASWPLSTQTVQAFYADNLTCRNILQYAAEIAGKFVRCNTSGEVIFDWYTNATDSIKPGVDTNAVAYKQDGLTYSKYASVAVDAVAVKPVGTEGAAYIYPSSVASVTASDPNGDGNIVLTNLTATDDGQGNITTNASAEDDNSDGNVEITTSAPASNTLVISGNLLLMNASTTIYNNVAQNLYNIVSVLPSFRYAEVSLFPDENPFRAGKFVSVTDAQGVSFTFPVFEMQVSAAASVLRSSGNPTYAENTTGESKAFANLAANIVQLEKLKVGWADIQEALVQYLKLYGFMEVYEDSTLTTSGGQIGYVTGHNDFGSGIAIKKRDLIEDPTSYPLGSYYMGSTVVAGLNSAFIGYGSVLSVDGGVEVNEEDFPVYVKLNGSGVSIGVGCLDAALEHEIPSVTFGGGTNSPRTFRPVNTFNGYSDFEEVITVEGNVVSGTTVLWTNSDPTTSFAAQTLTISGLSEYNLFTVICGRDATNNGVCNTTVCYVPGTGETMYDLSHSAVGNSYEAVVRQRNVYFTRSANTVRFSAGWITGGSGDDNTQMIPIYILGRKI